MNVLTDSDISLLLQNETVASVLSSDAVKTRFRLPLSDAVKEKLKSGLGLDLFSVEEVPMMYIRGDMAPHSDFGVSDFKNTYLVYLTDSGGKFVVDGLEYNITKGCGFKFERGLSHGTIGTEGEGRLMIGPLSDMGFEVGSGPLPFEWELTEASTTTFTIHVSRLADGAQPNDMYEFQFYKNAGQLVSTYDYVWNPDVGTVEIDYVTIAPGLSYSPGDTFNVAIKNKNHGNVFVYADNNTARNTPTFNDVTIPGGGGGGAPCFVAASQLLTSTGYKAAEDIKSGDLLMTADGRQVAVTAYSFTVEKAYKDSAPFLIPKNSISMGCPTADLRLSPWHAFQMKKGLWMKPMSAFELGMPVKQYDLGKSVTYYHFEAPNFFKDNFVCDGAVVESFGGIQTHDFKGRVYTYNSTLKGYTRAAGKSVSKAIMM